MKRKTEADLYLMLIPGITFYFIFKYIPLYGILMAFKDYNFMIGVFKSPWVGIKRPFVLATFHPLTRKFLKKAGKGFQEGSLLTPAAWSRYQISALAPA
ncbi:MAG TPA: hypothetical protein PLW34_06925 [Termitinemataceae bacterium]|nr:hypothetical protein [Termitinemataceae bacterium]HOM23410.1 hypothetical protein [Termitinemataceae bacterium]HPQ01352.1 hypothetical protein [Termitinemataceae bacterium]